MHHVSFYVNTSNVTSRKQKYDELQKTRNNYSREQI